MFTSIVANRRAPAAAAPTKRRQLPSRHRATSPATASRIAVKML